MGSDSICSLLLQTRMALLVIEEQVSSTRAIYLHMLQLPKNQVTLEYMHNHSCIPREHGRVRSTRAISHHHFQHQGIFFHGGLPVSSPMSADASDSPCRENHGVSSKDMYSPWSSGEYISPESSHLLGSITGIQQLTIITRKYNLQAPRLLTLHTVDNSMQCRMVAR